jgi:hypothetical protein
MEMTITLGAARDLDWTAVLQTGGIVIQSLTALLTVWLGWRAASLSLADRAAERRKANRQTWITLAGIAKLVDAVPDAIAEPDHFKRFSLLVPPSNDLQRIDPSSIDSVTGANGYLELKALVELLMRDAPPAAAAAQAALASARDQLAEGMAEISRRPSR